LALAQMFLNKRICLSIYLSIYAVEKLHNKSTTSSQLFDNSYSL
jgi:hypothetical protein